MNVRKRLLGTDEDRQGGGRQESVGVGSDQHALCMFVSEFHKPTHNPYIIVSYNTL